MLSLAQRFACLFWAMTATVVSTQISAYVAAIAPTFERDSLVTESPPLLPQPLINLKSNLTNYTIPANYGSASFNVVRALYPGGTAVSVVRQGSNRDTFEAEIAFGKSRLYADANGTRLSYTEQIDTRFDTIYDLASLTKMFTTVAALKQLEGGSLDLNATAATYIPDFAVNGKENITILMLLTHTSGFDADPVPGLWNGYQTYEARVKAILSQTIINVPGSTYLYSDLNFMSLQLILERVTSLRLDELIARDITGPLGMRDTFFNRGNRKFSEELLNRIAVTEFQIEVLGAGEPAREQPVWGTVHDENAWALDGVAGHAGIFSTARDLSVFCQMILNNGSVPLHVQPTHSHVQRILQPQTVDLIFHNYNSRFPGNAHGLGFELDQFYWSGAMQGLNVAGHTGYTGTSMAIDRGSGTFWVLMTNRVHPSRTWSNVNVVREAMGNFVARALGRVV